MRASLFAAFALWFPLLVNAAPPPVEAFMNYAKYESVTVSPGGSYLAITRRNDQDEILTILTKDMKLSGETRFPGLDIERLDWANDRRLLLQPSRRFGGITADKMPTGDIMGVDADGKNSARLFGWSATESQRGTHVRRREFLRAPARFLGRLPNEPDSVLIQTYAFGTDAEYNSVYRMNVNTGELDKVITSPVRSGTFLLDLEKRPVFVLGWSIAGHRQVFHRSREGGEWKMLATAKQEEGLNQPVGPWNDEGEFLAMNDRDAPTMGVHLFAPETGTSRLLFRDPNVDVTFPLLDPTGKPWCFEYQSHFPEYWYPDPQHPLAVTHRWLRETYPGFRVEITSSTDDMASVVARVSAPRKPPVHLLVDAKQPKVLVNLATYPDLKSEDLADVEPIEFKARDGLAIRGYLTVPNVKEKKNLPLIVIVHRGPHIFAHTYDFDPEAQLFASRGYAVLQVNFRGSAGRGRDFTAAGYGQWGQAMQDDVTDAVKWAIGDGVADPKRICIFGAAYGGYAALTGAYREPDLFRCAVGIAGEYDLSLKYDTRHSRIAAIMSNMLEPSLGKDMEDLKRRSPVYNAEKIRAAVLMVHSRSDDRIPFDHAARMRAALEKAANPPELITERGVTRDVISQRNRAETYQRVLDFFAKHLATPTDDS